MEGARGGVAGGGLRVAEAVFFSYNTMGRGGGGGAMAALCGISISLFKLLSILVLGGEEDWFRSPIPHLLPLIFGCT